MERFRVFGCFDHRHDEDLLSRLLQQSQLPDSCFELVAWSGVHRERPDWEGSMRRDLDAVDQVVVICGEHGESADDLSAELRMVRDQSKPYLLLWGRRERPCTKPASAMPDDRFFTWIRDILNSQLATTHTLASQTRAEPASQA